MNEIKLKIFKNINKIENSVAQKGPKQLPRTWPKANMKETWLKKKIKNNKYKKVGSRTRTRPQTLSS